MSEEVRRHVRHRSLGGSSHELWTETWEVSGQPGSRSGRLVKLECEECGRVRGDPRFCRRGGEDLLGGPDCEDVIVGEVMES